jgi:hypothetical protein
MMGDGSDTAMFRHQNLTEQLLGKTNARKKKKSHWCYLSNDCLLTSDQSRHLVGNRVMDCLIRVATYSEYAGT